jgi:hypothetical protein
MESDTGVMDEEIHLKLKASPEKRLYSQEDIKFGHEIVDLDLSCEEEEEEDNDFTMIFESDLSQEEPNEDPLSHSLS